MTPHTKNASENTTRRNDQISLHCRSIWNNETSITFLQSNAGKSKVNGTDVKLPINATKSIDQSIVNEKEVGWLVHMCDDSKYIKMYAQ